MSFSQSRCQNTTPSLGEGSEIGSRYPFQFKVCFRVRRYNRAIEYMSERFDMFNDASVSRRGFLGSLGAVGALAAAAGLFGCSIQSGQASVSADAAGSATSIGTGARSGSIAIDPAAWGYDSDNDVYYQIGVQYCESPQAPTYESMGIYVPGAYFDATGNGDGTFTCAPSATGKVAGYTAATAPIVMPINTAGYSAQAAPTEYSSKGIATDDGLFSLEACRCIGACGLAPVVTVNGEVYGRMTVDKVDEILDKYEALAASEKEAEEA